ncbi:tyrosine-type recombinase/integrase [Burkholderia multivorans]|uniref:tyrosine-type recombinase/integrase n=1 Tax=Burkholderia multivorans TaxID=87883 RepID=UPI0021BF6706|nr:tyrosine-type recombinase/integrase [Burkholderia multivorans]
MAKKENIRTRTARAKLEHQNEPYWESLNRGLHIGYRTSKVGPGSWVGRFYHNKRYHHVTLDAFPEFADAKKMIEDWAKGIVNGALLPVEERKPETVEEACRKYVEERRTRKGKRTAYDASNRFERLVYGKPIGRIRLQFLKHNDITTWHENQCAGRPAAEIRKARDTANRNLKALKAALNFAYSKDWISEKKAWKGVQYFEKVAMNRDGWLSKEQRATLLAAMPDDLRIFATALFLTGARPGEMAKADVRDFNVETGKLRLNGKTGPRDIELSQKARELFAEQVKGRPEDAPIFVTDWRRRWTVDSWHSRFVDAREKAGMPKAVLYYARHTFISEALSQGIPVVDVARYTGTSLRMIDKNYGHLTTAARINAVSML